MKKSNPFYLAYTIAISILFFANCTTTVTKNDTPVKNDSIQSKTISITTREWPLLLNDSSILNKTSLPASAVIAFKKVSDTLKEEWEINSFLRIDSLKQQNKYEAYLESLDIGQVKDAEAFSIDTLSNRSFRIVIWGLKFSSYEACPYFSGNKIYATSLSNTQTPIHTVALLDNNSSGDAPYYAFTNGRCLIFEDGTISCEDSTEQGGETVTKGTKELEEVIKYSTSRKYKIESNGFIKVLENKKSPESTTYH